MPQQTRRRAGHVSKATWQHVVDAIDEPFDFNASDNSQKRPVCKNVVFKVQLLPEGEKINLFDLPNFLYAQYIPAKFALAIYSRFDMRSTALLPGSARNVRVGCTDVPSALYSCHLDRRDLASLGYRTVFNNTHVENNVVTSEVDFNINLDKLHRNNQDTVRYEPSSFPGASYQFYQNRSWKLVMFDSGKYNIMGFKQYKTLNELVTLGVALMSRYRSNETLPPVDQRHAWRKRKRYEVQETGRGAYDPDVEDVEDIIKRIEREERNLA